MSETGPRLMPIAHRNLAHLVDTARPTNSALRGRRESDRGAVAGVDDNALARRHLLERVGQHGVEVLLYLHLIADALLRIADDVDEQNAANESAVGVVRHQRIPGAAFHVAHHPLKVAALHHLHHFLHLLELAEQLVHGLDRHPGPGGNAALARSLDELRFAALLRGHGIDDAFDAAELLVVLQLRRVDLTHQLRRQLVDERSHAAHLLHLRDLLLEVLQVEALALLHLLGDALGLVEINLGVRLLHQRQDVAHAEDASRHAIRVERLDAAQFLADTDKLDRLAGHVPHREGCAAAGISIELGEDHARQRQASLKARATSPHPGLHGVDHETGSRPLHRGVQLGDLAHHGLVDRETAGGVDDEDVL